MASKYLCANDSTSFSTSFSASASEGAKARAALGPREVVLEVEVEVEVEVAVEVVLVGLWDPSTACLEAAGTDDRTAGTGAGGAF